MSETNLRPKPENTVDQTRVKHVTAVAWTLIVFVIFAAMTLINAPTWPAAFGIAAAGGMITVVCCSILRRG
jgi:hypothetical protein